jgi:Zn ribbon nucleic-acid-binding protein
MGRPSSDYTRCPDCQRRTVLFKFGKNGEDYLECTRCQWSVYRWADRYDTEQDRTERARWQAINPTEKD